MNLSTKQAVAGMFSVLYLRRSVECVGVEVKRALNAPLESEIIVCGELSIFTD
jgi:hypothetical protein